METHGVSCFGSKSLSGKEAATELWTRKNKNTCHLNHNSNKGTDFFTWKNGIRKKSKTFSTKMTPKKSTDFSKIQRQKTLFISQLQKCKTALDSIVLWKHLGWFSPGPGRNVSKCALFWNSMASRFQMQSTKIPKLRDHQPEIKSLKKCLRKFSLHGEISSKEIHDGNKRVAWLHWDQLGDKRFTRESKDTHLEADPSRT